MNENNYIINNYGSLDQLTVQLPLIYCITISVPYSHYIQLGTGNTKFI